MNVRVENRTGGSSTRMSAVGIEPYWTTGLRLRRGLLVDAKKPGRDRFRVCGEFGRRGDASEFYLAADLGLRLVFGDALAPFTVTIPAEDPGWEADDGEDGREGLRWRSPKGETPRIRIDMRIPKKRRSWQFRFDLCGFDFPAPQVGAVELELHAGESRAALTTAFKAKGKGRFRAVRDR